jgi:hypothetical protein
VPWHFWQMCEGSMMDPRPLQWWHLWTFEKKHSESRNKGQAKKERWRKQYFRVTVCWKNPIRWIISSAPFPFVQTSMVRTTQTYDKCREQKMQTYIAPRAFMLCACFSSSISTACITRNLTAIWGLDLKGQFCQVNVNRRQWKADLHRTTVISIF